MAADILYSAKRGLLHTMYLQLLTDSVKQDNVNATSMRFCYIL